MKKLLKALCYRTYHVANVDFDPATGSVRSSNPLPPGTSITITYDVLVAGTEPVQVCEVTQTDPRWWFKPAHQLIQRLTA